MHFVAVSNGLFEPDERWRKKEKESDRTREEIHLYMFCFENTGHTK